MSLHYYFRNADGDLEEITHRMRKYALTVTERAEEGQPASSTVLIDDPDGDFEIVGHRIFGIIEDEVPGENKTIFGGYTYDQTIRRGDTHRTGAAREWEVRLVDVNTVLSRRMLTEDDDDADRPAETDIERLEWLISIHATELIDDTRYLDSTLPVDMDAVNYDDQMVDDVTRQLTRTSLKNLYITYFTDGPDPNTDTVFSLVYMYDSSEEYSSDVKISNVLSDIDYGAEPRTVFEASVDSELTRDPSRIRSKIRIPYDGGKVTDELTSTRDEFARLDGVMPEINVKSEAKALAEAGKMLVQLSTQEDVITTSIYVPNSQVNDIRPGMRVEVKFSHFPGYEDWTWARVMQRTVSNEESEFQYKLTLELAIGPPAPPAPVLGCEDDLNQPHGTMTYDAASTVPYGAPDQGTPSLTNDGDDLTRNGWGGGYAGAPTVAIWRSDLGAAYDVVGFVVCSDWESSASPESPGLIEFQHSDNGSSWSDTTVTFVSKEIYAADKWRSFWEVDGGPISHRYWRIRLDTTGGGGFHSLGYLYTWCIVGT
jgi:hypothetical protein